MYILGIENYFRHKIKAKFGIKGNATYNKDSKYKDKGNIINYIYIYILFSC